MNELNLISIIVPIYNAESTLEKCINSLISQTYKNIEIILVDDGSPDSSSKICKNFSMKDNRIKVYHKENGGVSSARNYGLIHANGEYISFVDPDDWVESNMIEMMMKAILNDNADVCICGYERAFKSIREHVERHTFPKEIVLDKALIFDRFLGSNGWGTAAWNKIFSKNSINGIMYQNLKIGEDAVFCFDSLYKANKVTVISDIYYHYIISKNSVTISKFNKDKLYDYIYSRQYIAKHLDSFPDKVKIKAYNEYAMSYYYSISSYMFISNYKLKKDYNDIVINWNKFRCTNEYNKYVNKDLDKSIKKIVRFMPILKIKYLIISGIKNIIIYMINRGE